MIYAENILLCIAVPLLILLFFLRGNTRLFLGAFLVGMGVCLLGAYISGFVSIASGLGANTTAVYISPMIEELMKCLPLFFCPYLNMVLCINILHNISANQYNIILEFYNLL